MSLSAGRLNRLVGFKDTPTRKGQVTLRQLKESVRTAHARMQVRTAERDARVVVTRIRKEGEA